MTLSGAVAEVALSGAVEEVIPLTTKEHFLAVAEVVPYCMTDDKRPSLELYRDIRTDDK